MAIDVTASRVICRRNQPASESIVMDVNRQNGKIRLLYIIIFDQKCLPISRRIVFMTYDIIGGEYAPSANAIAFVSLIRAVKYSNGIVCSRSCSLVHASARTHSRQHPPYGYEMLFITIFCF